MTTPPETAGALATTTESTDGLMTVGPHSGQLHPYLEGLRACVGDGAGFERLHALTLNANEPRLVGAYISLITERECLQTLTDWSEDSAEAQALAAVGHAASSMPSLVAALRAVAPEERASRVLHGDLGAQYLSGMAGVRQPTSEHLPPHAIGFIQHLRAFLLVRAVEALEDGFARERNLEVACTATRQACDVTGDPRMNWLLEIANHEVDFEEFRYELQARCQLAKKDRKWSDAARAFFRSMQVIAEGGPWRPASTAQMAPDVLLRIPLRNARDAAPSFFATSDGPYPPGIVHLKTKGDTSLSVLVTAADESHTNYRNGRIGRGLILESTESVQFLRHSWHQLSRAEESAFQARIEELLASSDAVDRFGAVATLIATIAGKPMSGAGELPLTDELLTDWSVDARSGSMQRRPPRFGRRWKIEDHPEAKTIWVAPQAEYWRVQLCHTAARTLRDLTEAKPSATIAELWSKLDAGTTIHEWFGNRFAVTQALLRLTSPCTSTAISQQAFESAGDHKLARLVGSEVRTGLPAACAYGAYKSDVVLDALAPRTVNSLYAVVAPTASGHINACGSDLDIHVDRVRGELAKLIERTGGLGVDPGAWIEHHNALTSLVVIALLASTGSRPVNSPFESLRWFDFERMIVYVEDKRSGPTRGSRLCVLSKVAQELLAQHYLPHLSRLVEHLSSTAPEFSAELKRVLNRDCDAILPLFLYLSKGAELAWSEVGEQRLAVESGINWPLPWNLFRHLHATELVRRGVHPEIVDALLSHGDRGAESHGDHSLRIPESDLEAARPHVDALQVELGLGCPNTPAVRPRLDPSLKLAASCAEPRHFGRAARTHQRAATERRARERATKEIQAMVGDAPADSLSSDQWHQIAHRMLFREDSVPHPNASIRYEAFEQFVAGLWQNSRILPKLKRRYSILQEPESVFREDSIEAPRLLGNLGQRFESVIASLATKVIAPSLVAALCSTDLVLTGKVAHRKPLMSLLANDESFRVVKAFGGFWFEWTDAETWRDGRPMLRIPILPRTAQWIDTLVAERKHFRTLERLPKELDFLASGGSAMSALTRLAVLQDQSNVWTLPGIEAAYLAGRAIFPGLPHDDWYRVETGSARLATRETTEAEAENPLAAGDVYFMAHHHRATSTTKPPAAATSAQLFDKVSRIISAKGAQVEASRASIEVAIKEAGFRRGDVPFLLGHFVLHLLKRKSKKRARDALRMVTVLRYLKSLIPPFVELAHDLNLCEMDEEELTDLYCSILDWWTDHFKARQLSAEAGDDAPGESKSRLSPDEQAIDAASRTLRQLKEFHEFASIVYGLDDPDWSMISTGKVGAIGRPGLVTVAEYGLVRTALIGKRSIGELPNDTLSQLFVLMSCARFGLRLGEAVGLYRQDWVESDGAVVLLVRPNRVRPLKTAHSKRQVPLCEDLEQEELEIIAELIRRWDNVNKEGRDAPMLPGVNAGSFAAVRNSIGSVLRDVLKLATCNPATTIHFLRHSFATRVLAILRGLALGKGEKFAPDRTQHLRRLLLGSDSLGRRTLWAIARLLGHASPTITARCYLHGVDAWLSKPNGWRVQTATVGFSNALIDLDSSDLDSSYKHVEYTVREQTVLVESSMLTLTRFCRLLVQGRTRQSALTTSGVEENVVSRFEDLLGQYQARCVPDDTQSESGEGTVAPTGESVSELLTSIPLPRWDALAQRIEGRDAPAVSNAAFDVSETIGRKRQIVLFLPQHYEALIDVLKWLDLDAKQVWVVPSRNASAPTSAWIEKDPIKSLVVKACLLGTTFQIDTATYGPFKQPFPSRAVMVPAVPSELPRTRHEVMFIWLAWHACQGTSAAP